MVVFYSKGKIAKKNIKTRYRRSKFMQKQNGARKTKLKGVQTESLIGTVVCYGHPHAYGFHHFLNDSLFVGPSFPVKKHFTTKLFPISFLWG